MSDNYETRVKRGFKWKMETSFGISEGFTLDDLDTKNLEQAENDFEIAFITIRRTLEENESRCLDDEMDRLQVCQEVARSITQAFSVKNKRSI